MDLWTHFRELAAAYSPSSESENAEQTGELLATRRRIRRLNERAQLALLRDWLLHDYVAAYCRSLAATRIFRRCYWLDGLGLDARSSTPVGGTEIRGSAEISSNGKGPGNAKSQNQKAKKKKVREPIPLALQPLAALSDELAREPRPITLHGLFLAAGSSKRSALTSPATLDTEMPEESGIIPASWLESAPALLQTVEQAPTIFLLNPLGASLFSADHLAPILARALPTELCLLLPHKQIETHLRAAFARPEQAATLSKLLRTDRWKTLSLEPGEQSQTIQGFIELLLASLQRHFPYPIQPLRFPLPPGPATVEDAPFTLLFATRRLDSLYCMNDAVSHYRRKVEEASYRGVLGEEWFTEQQQARYQAALQRLRERIQQQVEAQRRVRWPDLRQHLLLAHFGQFPLQDYDTSIQQLLLNREVYCIWRSPAPASTEERIPGNEDTLIWR